MSHTTKFKILFLFVFSIIIVWKNYVIVIGQSASTVLVALNKAEGTLAIIDPNEMKLIGKVPTGDGPHEVVLSADGKTAYVANYGAQTPGNSLSVIDLESKKELRRVDLAPLLRPHGLVMGKDGKVYFTAEVNRLVARYDPAANKVDWMTGTGQNASHMLVLSPNQNVIYTANIASDSISAIEMKPSAPGPPKITHIPVGKQPEAIDISPDGKEVWAGLNGEGAIDIVDTQTNKFKEKISLGGRPYRVTFAPDGRQVVATMPNTKELIVLDAATRKEVKRIKLESAPLGIVFSKNGKFAFVSVVQNDYVLKIDLEKSEVLGKTETGVAPDGVALAGM